MNVACTEPAVAVVETTNRFTADAPVANNSDHWRHTDAVRERVRVQGEASDLVIVVESPNAGTLRVGSGLAVPLRGVCAHRTLKIRHLNVSIGDHQTRVVVNRVRDDIAPVLTQCGYGRPGTSGFYGSALLSAALIGNSGRLSVEVELEDGSTVSRELGAFEIVDGRREPLDLVKPEGEDSVAVVMATYRPDAQAFKRQIESIRSQSLTSWHLLIRDDASGPESLAMMRDVIADDARITLIEGQRNLGFYGNFENVLRQVPTWADYVALADQDDRWHDAKLQTLVDTLKAGGPDMALAYSDMRIVDSTGEVISETYWRGRNNNFSDIDVMMLANTVTGAASMFRASLLDAVLPFPDRIGDAFHDHWIALSAMVRGPLGYIETPLYDYVQHEQAVIGHADFDTPAVSERVRKVASAPLKKSFWTSLKNRLVTGRQSALNIHRYECRRLELIADTLVARYPLMSTKTLRALNAYGRGAASGLGLLLKHVKVLRGNHSTNDAEVRLGLGYLAYALDPVIQRTSALMGRRSGKSAGGDA